jgi:glycine oxidase
VAAQSDSFDVAVVGGGAIGLASAWRAAQRGAHVVVLDAGTPGAWHVAAGMLAPVSEAEFGERALLELGLESARRYPSFCAELESPGLREVGTLVVARDRDEAEALDRLAAFRAGLGLPVERLRPTQARALEPALAPTVRLALDIPSDHSIDPRRLVAALARAFGGELRRARVRALAVSGERVTGVVLEDGVVHADAVVVAAGVDVARLDMPEHARVPVRPVKGQVLRLRDPHGPGLIERTIRGESAYLVPRGDGRYVLGATMEERGWDTTPTAGGVYELLRDVGEVVPGVFELDVEELSAGLRPATPDNLPAIGPGALDGLVWAAGHFRNGILLTPVTADLVAAALAGEALPEWAAPADPRRFWGNRFADSREGIASRIPPGVPA